jgi:type IV secretion system protein VirD4
MANERALGISFIYAAQTWRQLAAIFGDTEARTLYGLTNVVIVFGGGKDIGFNKEISDLVGTTRIARTTWQHGRGGGRSTSGDDMLIIRPEEVRQLPERQALVVAENTRPIIARLARSIDGRHGRQLLAQQREIQTRLRGRAQIGLDGRVSPGAAPSGRSRRRR